MGNCMNACLPKSSKDHHGLGTETTRTTLNPQKQLGRERRSRTRGVMVSESLKTCDGEGRRRKDDHDDTQKNGGDKEGIVRVKIVLTKEELQWLMTQLKNDGEKRLEYMLKEIEKGRKKVVCDGGKRNGWKPSLERITETPECVRS